MFNSLKRFIYANILPETLFSERTDLEEVKRLFSNHVRSVEIENHSFCNRTCWFCPNSFIDRRTENTLLKPSIFKKIIKNLEEINYDQTLIWSRYHEPLAFESIFENITYARKKLKNSFFYLISNGDYLKPDTLSKLHLAGLDMLQISLYLPHGEQYNDENIDKAVDRLKRKSNYDISKIKQEDKNNRQFCFKNAPLKTIINCHNFSSESIISTRGGSIFDGDKKNYHRTSACFSPIHKVTIDFNGIGVLCCHTRSDNNDSKDAIIGDLSVEDYNLFHFYRDLAPKRIALVKSGKKEGACKTCKQELGGPHLLGRNKFMTKIIHKTGLDKNVFDYFLKKRKNKKLFQN